MLKRITVCVLSLSIALFSLAIAQNQSGAVKPVKKSVLILKDSSNLEIAVSRIVKDTLAKFGYDVKEASLANVNKENASSYNVSIVFSAINPGKEIDPRIDKFIASKTDTASKVILYTVYGTVYNKTETVDATTQATRTLHPQIIADHILKTFKVQSKK